MLDWFKGHWTFTREITHANGQIDLVDGSVGFTPRGAGLIYDELGVLRIGSREFRTERRYFWTLRDDEIIVEFEDGRFFHKFSMSKTSSHHLCLPDDYWVDYKFGTETWEAKWRVKGPRKDYTMRTRYTR